MLEIEPARLGTLELGDTWLPYVDLVDLDFMPTRLMLGGREYAYVQSILVQGHGAVLPGMIKELRDAGRKPLIVERTNRYNVFATVS